MLLGECRRARVRPAGGFSGPTLLLAIPELTIMILSSKWRYDAAWGPGRVAASLDSDLLITRIASILRWYGAGAKTFGPLRARRRR